MKPTKKQIMEQEWQKVRRSFYYPQLPHPKLNQDIPNGQINFKNLQIEINPNYLEELAQAGCDNNIGFNALLGHEVGHFVDYPGSVLNLLRLHKVAREDLDEQQAYATREAFLNIQNNTNLVKNRGYESIPLALKPEVIKTKGIDKVLFGLYQHLWKKDLGLKLNKKEKTLVQRLESIDYLNKSLQEQNLREFIGVVKDYLNQENQGGGKTGKQGQGENEKQNQGSTLGGFSDNQIREGIRQFAQESKPGEFEGIIGEVLRELDKKGKKGGLEEKTRNQSSGAGTERGNLIIARNFYSALAENFSVPIRKKQIEKNGSLYPHSHEEFSMDDSVVELDTFSTPGIIPGISQKWIKKQGETTQNYFGIPASLVVIDSSGSMPSPDESISIPVLGGTVIANAYLNNDSKVTIYNFSADNIVVGPSKNKERLHEIIRTYQNGGTVFNPDTVEKIVKEQKNVDISVISDMEISNLGDFLAYTSNLPNVHRVHLFYTNSGNIGGIAEELKHKQNIAILPLHSQEDIRKITMGELKKSIK